MFLKVSNNYEISELKYKYLFLRKGLVAFLSISDLLELSLAGVCSALLHSGSWEMEV